MNEKWEYVDIRCWNYRLNGVGEPGVVRIDKDRFCASTLNKSKEMKP